MYPSSGYFDLQVNGFAGIDFNGDQLNEADLCMACERLRADGVDGILATVITDEIDAMSRRLDAIARSRARNSVIAELVWGIHIEGPFLNGQPGYIGAHPPAAARPADVASMQRLLDAAGGLTRIVTLAPECDPGLRVTRKLVDEGICVAAGHCNPSLDQLRAAVDAGLSMFTHLGNGCPLDLHRHDNIIQRVLSFAEHLWIGFIADGVHVPFHALGNYLRCAGVEHSFVVSDAIAAAGMGPGKFTLGGREVVVDENLATWSADRSHLMGSAGTMREAARKLSTVLRLTEEQLTALLIDNPRLAIRFN